MKKSNSTLKETAILSLGEIIVSLLVIGGFALASLATEVSILSAVLGAVLGSIITVLNYFFLSLSVNRSIDQYLELRGSREMTDEEAMKFTNEHSMKIQNAIKISFIVRTVTMLASLVCAFIFIKIINPLATVIPILAYRPILTVGELIRKRADKAPDPQNFIVYDNDEDAEETDEAEISAEKESDE